MIDRLTAYGQALQFTEPDVVGRLKKDQTFLLELDIESHELQVAVYDDPAMAAAQYGELEGVETKDGVLVAVESLATLLAGLAPGSRARLLSRFSTSPPTLRRGKVVPHTLEYEVTVYPR